MSKSFAWILFLSSVGCFIMGFRTQQIRVAAEIEQTRALEPMLTADELSEMADASELYDE